MKRINLLLFFCLFVLRISISAQTFVHCSEAGALSSAITALNINKDTITDLQISGYIDARDFKEMLYYQELKSIDMGKVSINAYTGIDGPLVNIVDGIKLPITYSANQIPSSGIGFNIERFVFPDSLINIGNSVFSGRNIREITFPSKLESIGDYAFAECVHLNNVVIPANLRYLGECAFRNCKELNTPIVFPGTLEVIGNAPFMYCVKVPRITFDKQSPYFVVDDKDVVYSSNLDTLLFFPPYYKGKYQMNAKTKIIKRQSVEGVEGLSALIFPDSLESLGTQAFLGCKNLKWINLKNATTFTSHIKSGGPASAFGGCPIDTIYVSCRQQPATSARLILLSFLTETSCKIFVPLDSVEVFKKDSLWSEFSHIYGIETMPISFDKPEITSFRIINITPQASDTTFNSVTFELHGNNILDYKLSSEYEEGGNNQAYVFKNDTSFYTIVNIDRRRNNRFELYGTDAIGNKSEMKEIILHADITNSLNNELAENLVIYSCCKGFLNVNNKSNQTLRVKVYSILGNYILENDVLPGRNKYEISNGSGIYIVSIESNLRKCITQKIFVK